MNQQDRSPLTPPPIPVRLQRYEETAAPPRRKFWLHPASGMFVLAVDWFFFGTEIITLELALFLSCFLAFTITTLGVFWIQRAKGGDSIPAAVAKGLFGGFIAGLPTSVGGTILGTLVLVLSGLSSWNQRRGPK